MLEHDNHKKYNFRIENICPMIISYGILFMPPLVVVDIFVHINMQSTSVQVLEPGGCKLGVVAHWAFWNAGMNIERHWIIRVYKNNLKMMLNTQNASLGTTNHDIHRSFIWKHLWKARWQQCNSFVSFNHLANHQNHE